MSFLNEWLPVFAGVLLGLGASLLFSKVNRSWATALWGALCPLGGVASSAINGELGGPWQGYFVSSDTLVVAGASVAVVSFAWATRMLALRR